MDFSKPSDGRCVSALGRKKCRGKRQTQRRFVRVFRAVSALWVLAIGLVAAFSGCSTISQESLLVEAGTHQFPSGENPWDDFDRQLKTQGFFDLESAKKLPGIPKNLRPPDNAKNPRIYVGLSSERSYTLLAVSTPRNFVTATVHIHAHGSKKERRSYIRGSLAWLEQLVSDLVETNPYGKPSALKKIQQTRAEYE